ncbi:MAG: chromate efflux transporter [Gammaproteobacteria bacterium]
MDETPEAPDLSERGGSVTEIFLTFLRLGLTSFGGPIAHLMYFRRELVERGRWLSEHDYAQLIGLCQFLPGPASSQAGFAIGLLRGGWPGALAAFTAFTLPSALLLFAFALLLPELGGPLGLAAIHGLKLVALAVVAHGLLGMSRSLCPDPPRVAIALVAAGIIVFLGQAWAQLLVVILSATAGLLVCRDLQPLAQGGFDPGFGPGPGGLLIGAFALLLIGLPFIADGSSSAIDVFEAFYRAGALVFGGGHVVLPLLEETVVRPGWIPADDFVAGYGAAQAVPGPMFTLAAYLGAQLPGVQGGLGGAAIALCGIFLPGFLLVAGVLPLWRGIAGRAHAVRAIAGINAAVVGLLAAALYDPIWISAVRGGPDLVIGLVGFVLLAKWRVSAIVVVLWCVAASVFVAMALA